MAEPVVFRDMRDREKKERDRLEQRRFILEQLKKKQGGVLRPDLQGELEKINDKLGTKKKPNLAVVDPLFLEVQKAFKETGQDVKDHVDGKLPSQIPPAPVYRKAAQQAPRRPPTPLTENEIALAAVFGVLQREGHDVPPDQATRTDLYKRFIKDLTTARGEFNANKDLFEAVLPVLVREGDQVGEKVVHAHQWSAVVRNLANQKVGFNDDLLPLKTRAALANVEGVDDGAPPSSINIDLPDLEEQADVEILADNLHAMQALYFASMLEELKLFQVADKLVEQFHNGMLPLGKGSAGDKLFAFWKDSSDRLSEVERRNLYARAFGFPGGEATQGNPNREFEDLWLRFVSGVSSFMRQMSVDDLLRAKIPATISQEHVRKAGRDLAANLSLHGYGVAYFAATELQNQINDIIDLFSDREIKNAYGARDMWQVIDQVATLELGGARNSVRYRTMASAGAVIIRWLADHAKQLAGASLARVLDVEEISNPPPRAKGTKPTTNPNDQDLVNACEQWLAVTGTSEERVEEFSQPSEGPMTTSRPIQIPSVAREALAAAGIQMGNGRG